MNEYSTPKVTIDLAEYEDLKKAAAEATEAKREDLALIAFCTALNSGMLNGYAPTVMDAIRRQGKISVVITTGKEMILRPEDISIIKL